MNIENGMKMVTNVRGFRIIFHEKYPKSGKYARLIQESSTVGNYEDALDYPGGSFLWIGENHHLNREEIKELIQQLQYWINNKCLKEKEYDPKPTPQTRRTR